MTEAMTKAGPCQVRTNTESPCPRSAEVEILGVAFCGPCARQQEAYFAIGELTREGAQGLRGRALAKALERMRWGLAGSPKGIGAEMPHGLSGVPECTPLALSNGEERQRKSVCAREVGSGTSNLGRTFSLAGRSLPFRWY